MRRRGDASGSPVFGSPGLGGDKQRVDRDGERGVSKKILFFACALPGDGDTFRRSFRLDILPNRYSGVCLYDFCKFHVKNRDALYVCSG